MQTERILLYLSRAACILAFFVITAGAYTRLSDAGLGCPDWPGCYGRMLISQEEEYIKQANEAYPDHPLESEKAGLEMAHRYIAGILGLLILAITVLAWFKKASKKRRLFSSGLLALVIFQALLGMWTVTLLLKPLIVILHLFGGMSILALLYWLMLQLQSETTVQASFREPQLLPWVTTGLLILVAQISLGGWTSTNYAALACPDFPGCQGEYWPDMNFKEGFILWRGLGIDYEGGVLDGEARTAIHMTHRIGAVIAFFTILAVAVRALAVSSSPIRVAGTVTLVLLLLQVVLGIANVIMNLPLYVAVAHNGVAALLLLSLVTLLHQSIIIKSN